MRFLSYQFTDPGGREPNEDSVGVFTNGDFYAWIAADGLGGHVGGELASAEAVQSLETSLKTCRKMDQDFVDQAFMKINDDVDMLGGPLTTAVCGFSDGKQLWYANNGDSRLIFLRGKKITEHTNDHSMAYLAYMAGAIEYEEIPLHPAQNRLYHSVGNEIDFFAEKYPVIDLQPGDAFLLCTDGFWEMIRSAEIERALNISPTAEEWMMNMLAVLQPRLLPTSDNYSAVCVIVLED